jgi:hypothetical protein
VLVTLLEGITVSYLQPSWVQVYCTDAGVVINAVRRYRPCVNIYAFVEGNLGCLVEALLRLELDRSCGSSGELGRLRPGDNDNDDACMLNKILN